MLTKSQKEFEIVISEDLEDEEIVNKMKKRISVGIFMVELLKAKMITVKVIILCVGRLIEKPAEYDVCHACDILRLTIPLVKTRNGVVNKEITKYCNILKDLNTKNLLTNRSKFKVDELLTVVSNHKIM